MRVLLEVFSPSQRENSALEGGKNKQNSGDKVQGVEHRDQPGFDLSFATWSPEPCQE